MSDEKEEPKDHFAECVGTDGVFRRILITRSEYEALLKRGATPVKESKAAWPNGGHSDGT